VKPVYLDTRRAPFRTWRKAAGSDSLSSWPVTTLSVKNSSREVNEHKDRRVSIFHSQNEQEPFGKSAGSLERFDPSNDPSESLRIDLAPSVFRVNHVAVMKNAQ
jgi:hypothetical protein